MLKQLALVSFLILHAALTYANPAPLGIELDKSTLDDVKKSYEIDKTQSSATRGYYYNFLNTSRIKMDGLKDAFVISDDKDIVVAVILEFNKSKFNELLQTLSKKYKVVSSETPFVGDKLVTLEDKDCFIEIQSPHMSFEMTVSYLTERYASAHNQRIDEEEKAQKANTESML